jgi:hypothetical protein
MSENNNTITEVNILKSCGLRITVENLRYLYERFGASAQLPDNCFISNLADDEDNPLIRDCDEIVLEDLSWTGSDSGESWNEVFCDQVVPRLLGQADIEVMWDMDTDTQESYYNISSGEIYPGYQELGE